MDSHPGDWDLTNAEIYIRGIRTANIRLKVLHISTPAIDRVYDVKILMTFKYNNKL